MMHAVHSTKFDDRLQTTLMASSKLEEAEEGIEAQGGVPVEGVAVLHVV